MSVERSGSRAATDTHFLNGRLGIALMLVNGSAALERPVGIANVEAVAEACVSDWTVYARTGWRCSWPAGRH